MNRKLEIFEKVLTNPFDNDQFVGFVREFLNNVELVAPTKITKNIVIFLSMWMVIITSEITRVKMEIK